MIYLCGIRFKDKNQLLWINCAKRLKNVIEAGMSIIFSTLTSWVSINKIED